MVILATLAASCGAPNGDRAKTCSLQRLASLPIISNELGSPVVAILIEDQPRRMLLDTGGFWSLLDASLVGDHSLVPSREMRLGLGGLPLNNAVTMRSVQIGSVTETNVDFYLAPSGYLGPGIDGTLGANWLSSVDVEIDPVKNMVYLFDQKHCAGDVVYWPHRDLAVVAFQFDWRQRLMTIPMTLDGKKIQAFIDTGTSDTVLSLEAARDLFGLTPDSPGVERYSGSAGNSDKTGATYRYQFQSLAMDGITFDHPWLILSTNKNGVPDLLLGMRQMHDLHLYFANDEQKLYATRAAGDIAGLAAEADAPGGRVSARPTPADEMNALDLVQAAQAALAAGDPNRALAALDKALAINPRSGRAFFGRAFVYSLKGDRVKTMQALDQAIEVDPNLAAAYSARSSLFRTVGDYDRAFADADRAVKLLPQSATALINRCQLGAMVGRLDTALADCVAAVKLGPAQPAVLDTRAFAYLKAGRFDDAIADYDAVLGKAPQSASSLYGRGLARRQKGDTSRGDADVAAAEKIDADIARRFGK